MIIIGLTYDESNGLFSVPVILSRIGYKTSFNTQNLRIQTNMYIDTGSSLTSIIDIDASRLGIDSSSLPKENIGGVGGITNIPVTNEIAITLLDLQNSPINVKLEKVAIFPSVVKRKIDKGGGLYRQKGTVEGRMVNILGLDSLESLRGKLIINMKGKDGKIEI